MAIRNTTLIIKNNSVPNAPFSGATLLKGEAIVNTADGILMFSGVTSSTPEWTPAGPGGNSTFFEVGSNLYDLRLRNQITQYQGQSGVNLDGKFLSGTTSGFVLADITDIGSITGYVYNPLTNTFTLSQSNGSTFDAQITSVSGLTVDNLTAGRVVYVGVGGELTDEAGFEYNDSLNTLTVGNIFVTNPSGSTAFIGQGGLVIGSGGSTSTSGVGDLVVHGDLTVFGNTTTISTTELYIEDPQIELNYNPSGDTSLSSIGSGILIQDGGGVSGQNVKIGVGQLFGSSISGDTTEYTSPTGFENRGWVTQLNDIVIRNSSPINFGDPDGVRVLTEFDTLDGGQY